MKYNLFGYLQLVHEKIKYNIPSIFFLQAKLTPELRGYKVSSISGKT